MEASEAQDYFEAACIDAGVDPESVVFIPYTNEPPPTIHLAALFAQGTVPSSQELTPLSGDQRTAAQDPARHRITAWQRESPELMAALVRHEVEHIKQWNEAGKTTFAVARALNGLLDHTGYVGLPASGQIYNLIPIELDANGAASAFIRARIGDKRADEMEKTIDPGLFRVRPAPEPTETLATRCLCHASLWPTEAEQAIVRDGLTPDRVFASLLGGGVATWAELRDDPALEPLRGDVRASVPTRESLTGDLVEAWRPHRDAVFAAVDRARAVVGLGPTPRPPGW